MHSARIVSVAALLGLALLLVALVPNQWNQVQAGKKKMMKNAIMAAILLNGGKKILLPLPIPIPVPFLKQTQPIYYEQQQAYGGGGGGGSGGGGGTSHYNNHY